MFFFLKIIIQTFLGIDREFIPDLLFGDLSLGCSNLLGKMTYFQVTLPIIGILEITSGLCIIYIL